MIHTVQMSGVLTPVGVSRTGPKIISNPEAESLVLVPLPDEEEEEFTLAQPSEVSY